MIDGSLWPRMSRGMVGPIAIICKDIHNRALIMMHVHAI